MRVRLVAQQLQHIDKMIELRPTSSLLINICGPKHDFISFDTVVHLKFKRVKLTRDRNVHVECSKNYTPVFVITASNID